MEPVEAGVSVRMMLSSSFRNWAWVLESAPRAAIWQAEADSMSALERPRRVVKDERVSVALFPSDSEVKGGRRLGIETAVQEEKRRVTSCRLLLVFRQGTVVQFASKGT